MVPFSFFMAILINLHPAAAAAQHSRGGLESTMITDYAKSIKLRRRQRPGEERSRVSQHAQQSQPA